MTTIGNGRYRLDSRIASGGMGEVWLATDMSLGRQVAVKLLHRSLSDDATFRARFEAEARHAASLHDPRIATVFDYGDELDAQGMHRSYLVMEYVDGRPLSALLKGPLPPEQAGHLIAQAADALAVAHAAGIVHRDVKPANFLVTPDRRVKITDFGVARAKGASSLTDTGTIIGTAAYVAPEVAAGHEATPQSDLYSLGVVLYECLAGQRPFIGDTPVAVALSHLRDAPPPLPDHLSAPLRDLVMRSMAKEPSARPVSAQAFGAELRQAVSDVTESDSAATRPMPAPVPVPPGSGHPPTSVMPTAAAGHSGAADDDRRGSRGMTWPLLAVAAAILLIVAVAVAISALNDDPADTTSRQPGTNGTSAEASGANEGPSQQTPQESTPDTSRAQTESTSQPTTESSTPTAETVFVDPDEYVGEKASDAEKALREMGLVPTRVNVDSDGEGESGERGTVADLEPVGDVPTGSEITVYVWSGNGGQGGSQDDD